MSQEQPSRQLPAPCIIDSGIIVNKADIQRLLNDLGRVRYIHSLDGQIQSEGEGWILEVFADSERATLVANRKIYLNVFSFDYLKLHQSPEQESFFDLIQENRQLRLIPISNVLQEQEVTSNIDAATLEAMVTQVLSAKWDVQLDDDDDDCPF
jgi:alpha-N-acetylglucosamine transferase